MLHGAHLIDLVHDTLLSEVVEVANNVGSERANIPLKLSVFLIFAVVNVNTNFMRSLFRLAASLRRHTLMFPL